MKIYDVYYLGISGGKDSTALLLWYLFESELPRDRLHVSFCDTGNEDRITYEYIEMLSELHPIHTICGDLDFYELAKKKGRFPSRKAQFCTQYLKLFPARDKVRELLLEHDDVIILNGVRREEGRASNSRGEIEEYGFDDGWCCDVYRPLINWTIDDVWNIHKKYLEMDTVINIVESDQELHDSHKSQIIEKMQAHGIPRNPLYDMGANRVGCYPCINCRKQELRYMAEYRPERIDHIAAWEAKIDSTFFRRNTTPKRHRSKLITTVAGEEMHVPTIHDVVQWSRTKRGGKQYEFFLPDNQISACDLGGLCE